MINGYSLFCSGGSRCSCCDERRATNLHLLTLGPIFRFFQLFSLVSV